MLIVWISLKMIPENQEKSNQLKNIRLYLKSISIG
jgi:hypothetical protein